MSIALLISLFGVGFGSGFMGAYAGGASLISIPFLIFLGIPPTVAIATNRLSQTGLTAAIIVRYLKSDKIQWKWAPLFACLAIAGGLIGAHVVISIDPHDLQRIMGLVILGVLPVFTFNNHLANENTAFEQKRWHFYFGSGLYFLVMIFGGFCGGGGMIMAAIVTTSFFGLTILQSNATNNVAWLTLCLAALYVFLQKNLIDWQVGCILMAGTSLGGFLGAHIGLQQGERIVKKVFIGVSLGCGIILLLK